jgi:hypothetical protein
MRLNDAGGLRDRNRPILPCVVKEVRDRSKKRVKANVSLQV